MNKSYLLKLDYGATGEGYTTIIASVIAENQEKAKENFLNKHMLEEAIGKDYYQSSFNYFIVGVELIDFTNDPEALLKAKEWLADCFKENYIEYVLAAEKSNALFEFYFKTYVNYS